MIKDGLFDKFPMEAVFGAHNWPGMAVGQFALKSGPAFASSNEFRIIDPAARARTRRCRTTASTRCRSPARWCRRSRPSSRRNKRPIDAGVISVTMIHAGEATNVVPDSCEIQGTVRTFTLEVLDLIETPHEGRSPSTPAPRSSATCEFEFTRNYPPTINHAAETEFARKVMTEHGRRRQRAASSSRRWAPRTSATSCSRSPAATS